jgi:GNAT superfamily N-acetyltransferase
MIRQARPEELEALSALALRSKAHWGYSAAFMLACRDELTVTSDLLPDTFVKETATGIVGFYSLSSCGAEAELELLFVEPSAMHRGFGHELLTHAQNQASAWGCRVVVIQGDPHACAFYERCGAVKVGESASTSIPNRMLPLYELAT